MKEGVKRLATETGAGQWGSALAFGCMMFGLDCTVYIVRARYDQKPYRRVLMEVWGADVNASPSTKTESGRSILKEDPNSPGSLGIAISEAAEDALTHERHHSLQRCGHGLLDLSADEIFLTAKLREYESVKIEDAKYIT